MRRLTLVLALFLLPTTAHAVGLGVDVGAGTWLLEGLQGDVHLSVEQELLDFLVIGARPGVSLTLTEPNPRVGFPIDLSVRLKLAFLYLEGLAGMLWMPSSIDPIRAHAAAGLGLQLWKFRVGVEVGYLQPSLSLLARVGFTFF
ncbi:MAG: hypothetical protein ACOZQL_39285 [Myxococcota bacterium]